MSIPLLIIVAPVVLSLSDLLVSLGISGGIVNKIASALFLALVAIIMILSRVLAGRTSQRMPNHLRLLFFLYLGLVFVSLIRFAISDPDRTMFGISRLLYLSALFALIVIWLSHKDNKGLDRAAFVVYLSLFFYVALNVLLYFLGVQGPNRGYDAVMLASVGIDIERVHFALSSGVNSFGPTAAALVSFSLGLLLYDNHKKKWGVAGLVLGLFGILMIDSRGALLACVLSFVIVKISAHGGVARAFCYWSLILFVPAMVVGTIALSQGAIAFEVLSSLSRSPDVDFSSNRAQLWLIGAGQVDVGSFEFFFGQGFRGVYGQGVLREISAVLGEDSSVRFVTMHNALIELFFDIGVIGLLVFIVMYIKMISWIEDCAAAKCQVVKALTGLFWVLLVTGLLESSPTIHHDTFLFWLLAAGVAVYMRKHEVVRGESSGNEVAYYAKKSC